MRKILFLAVCTLLLASCGKNPPLPVGVIKLHGILTPLPISLDRRGTHMISSGSTVIAYAESTTVDLHNYENKPVELQGSYDQSTVDLKPPIFVVTAALASDDHTKSWTIPSLGFTVRTPNDWQSKLSDKGVSFTMTGSTAPILTAAFRSWDDILFNGTGTGAMPSTARETLLISSFRAVRLTDQKGRVILMIDRGALPSIPFAQRMLSMVFTPPAGMTLADAADIYFAIELSLKIGDGPSSSSYSVPPMPSSGGTSSDDGSALGKPCGGVAGILCPSGYYCNITDRAQNIGKCAK